MKKINNKIPKVNLILSHANHTFRILDPQIGLPLDTLIAPQKEMFFFRCEEGSNSRFNLPQIGPWVFGPWTLV